jgi:hypothetical protein
MMPRGWLVDPVFVHFQIGTVAQIGDLLLCILWRRNDCLQLSRPLQPRDHSALRRRIGAQNDPDQLIVEDQLAGMSLASSPPVGRAGRVGAADQHEYRSVCIVQVIGNIIPMQRRLLHRFGEDKLNPVVP